MSFNCGNKEEILAPLRGNWAEYRRAWNRLHRDKMNAADRAWRSRHPEIHKVNHRKFILANGVAQTTFRSRISQKQATMSYQHWGPVEDAMLVSGMTEGQLVKELGRSIRAIQRRKHKLRKTQ